MSSESFGPSVFEQKTTGRAKKFCSAASDEISASCVEIYRLLNTLVVYGSLAFLLIYLVRISRPSSILLPNSLDAQCYS